MHRLYADFSLKRSFYHEVLRICPNFHDSKEFELSSRKISFAESISSDITEASHEIMCFHLEAALHLERWPEVEEFVHAMCRTEDDKVRAIMTDMILTSNLPIDSIIRNLTVWLILRAIESIPLIFGIGDTRLPKFHKCQSSHLR